MNADRKILFFCEGSLEQGFGHVGRCLALASALRDEHGQECVFGFRGSKQFERAIASRGFRTVCVADFENWTFSNESALILDLRLELSDSFFSKAETAGILLATLDDPTDNRLHCDLAFYPPVPQVQELDWTSFTGRLFRDWKYIPLRREFASPDHVYPDRDIPQLLLTMGGSDPRGLTIRALQALKKVRGEWSLKIIAGPLCNDLDKIANMTQELGKRVELLSNVDNMADLMRDSDLALASFGMTAYELAACGTPQLLLCLSEDHARSASALQQSGAAVSLGKYDRVETGELIESLSKFIFNRQLRRKMADKALKLNIGNGASNIASVIMDSLERQQ